MGKNSGYQTKKLPRIFPDNNQPDITDARTSALTNIIIENIVKDGGAPT